MLTKSFSPCITIRWPVVEIAQGVMIARPFPPPLGGTVMLLNQQGTGGAAAQVQPPGKSQ